MPQCYLLVGDCFKTPALLDQWATNFILNCLITLLIQEVIAKLVKVRKHLSRVLKMANGKSILYQWKK